MTEDQLNPEICPSALEEDGTLDRSKWDGAHAWHYDNTHVPVVVCAECGAIGEQFKCRHCGQYHIDYAKDGSEMLGVQCKLITS